MFLNTTYQDFKQFLEADDLCNNSTSNEASFDAPPWLSPISRTSTTPRISGRRCWNSENPLVATSQIMDRHDWDSNNARDAKSFEEEDVETLLPTATNQTQMVTWENPTFSWGITPNPSPFALGGNESYLLDYFVHGVSPRCTTWPADNPFTRTLMPVCLSTPDKPLFNILMAVASHQLSLLNDSRFEKDIWVYRGKALRSFQAEIGQLQSQRESLADWEQIISTLVMLTFFDVGPKSTSLMTLHSQNILTLLFKISHSSASAWRIHLRCARSLRRLLPTQVPMATGEKDLYKFFCAYFAQHEALSRTTSALPALYDDTSLQWFPPELGLDMTVIDSLLGCSHELISLISKISDLATEMQLLTPGASDQGSDAAAEILQERRNTIERRLHTLTQRLPSATPNLPGFSDHDSGTMEELGYIAETRRLSALIYLYFRVDGVPPGHAPISGLTGQIITIIPKISLRSHVLLWTLFIVGTMGISGSDGDSDRKLILERLVSLQHTRELKNVRIAREVVEAVCKIRDLRGPEGVGGWKDIVTAGGEGLSLC